MQKQVVSDTGPLITLEKKLHKLYKAGRINKKIYDGLKEIVQKEA